MASLCDPVLSPSVLHKASFPSFFWYRHEGSVLTPPVPSNFLKKQLAFWKAILALLIERGCDS